MDLGRWVSFSSARAHSQPCRPCMRVCLECEPDQICSRSDRRTTQTCRVKFKRSGGSALLRLIDIPSSPLLGRSPRSGCLHPFNFTRSPLRKTIIYVVTLIAARQNMRSLRSGGRETDGRTDGREDHHRRRRISVNRPSFVRATRFGAESAARPLRRRRNSPT